MDRLSLLRLFVQIAEEGSLSAAARACSISPSAATTGLKRLEERIGARLFLRTTRHLSLTPEGERFLADCRRILSDLDDAMNAAADTGPLRGEIRITATNDFGRIQLEPLLSDFMRENPGVGIALTLSDGVIDLTEEGYDLGIRTGPLMDSRLVAHLLVRGRRLVCASPQYWDARGRPQNPRQLAAHNCLVLIRPGAPQNNWQFKDEARGFSVRVSGDRTANDGSILRKWATDGVGVVLKSEFDIADELANGRLEPVLQNYTRSEVNLYAVHAGGRNLTRRVLALLQFLTTRLGKV